MDIGGMRSLGRNPQGNLAITKGPQWQTEQ